MTSRVFCYRPFEMPSSMTFWPMGGHSFHSLICRFAGGVENTFFHSMLENEKTFRTRGIFLWSSIYGLERGFGLLCARRALSSFLGRSCIPSQFFFFLKSARKWHFLVMERSSGWNLNTGIAVCVTKKWPQWNQLLVYLAENVFACIMIVNKDL